MDHPTLGHLDGGDGWRGTIRGVTLYVAVDEDEQGALDLAARLSEHWQAFVQRARTVAERDMRPLYNDTWREDAPPLDAAAFRARLEPEALQVWGPTSADLMFADRELFWGHAVVATFHDIREGEAIERAHGDGELFG